MGAPDILAHLEAAGIRLSRQGDNLLAAPKRAVTDPLLILMRAHKAELLEALPDEEVKTLPEVATNASEQRTMLAIDLLTSSELRALVEVVASFHGFTEQQRAEAWQIARADPLAALEWFRAQTAKIPRSVHISDDRITCQQCANLVGNKCMAWGQMDAARGWEPVQMHRRCEAFKPRSDDLDQRTGAERWPSLRRVDNK